MLRKIMLGGSFILSLAATGCQVPASGLPVCTGDEVAVILDCGPRSAREQDAEGRDLVTCQIGPHGDRECILEGDGFRFHCMPNSFCAARCGGPDPVCE